jgi:hypothetical protein
MLFPKRQMIMLTKVLALEVGAYGGEGQLYLSGSIRQRVPQMSR